MHDVLIVGGGVIGLTLGCELARGGMKVRIVERGQPGQEASWAGAGILPPARRRPQDPPLAQLYGLSYELHAGLAEQLRRDTGIDNGYRRCGAVYLSRDESTRLELEQLASHWRDQDIEVRQPSLAELARIEPSLDTSGLQSDYHLPGEAQLRNPRHLKALLALCYKLSVEITSGSPVDGFVTGRHGVDGVKTPGGVLQAEQYCVAGGAWTQQLLAGLGVDVAIKPVRGQMLLFDCGRRLLNGIFNDGPRDPVLRDDGLLLAGSTEEDVGFEKSTTTEATNDLHQFAMSLVPSLAAVPIVQSWAGLRPGTADGLPYIGRVPSYENLVVAAGHFRQGIYLSPGTAVVVGQLLRREKPEIDLAPFAVSRSSTSSQAASR